MKRMFQFILTFCLAICSDYSFGENLVRPKEAIIGHWVFNIDETIANFRDSEMSEDEISKFAAILKPQEIVISRALYSVQKPDKKALQTAYSVISESEECVLLQFEAPKIPSDIQKHEFCILQDQLLLPAPKKASEVYDRKL